MQVEQNMLILTDEPFCGCMPEDIRLKLFEPVEEHTLAEMFASVANKVGSLIHETDSDQWAIYALEEWHNIEQILVDQIVDVLIKDGSLQKPPAKGWFPIIVPFMERHGYYDGSGWWIKREQKGG